MWVDMDGYGRKCITTLTHPSSYIHPLPPLPQHTTPLQVCERQNQAVREADGRLEVRIGIDMYIKIYIITTDRPTHPTGRPCHDRGLRRRGRRALDGVGRLGRAAGLCRREAGGDGGGGVWCLLKRCLCMYQTIYIYPHVTHAHTHLPTNHRNTPKQNKNKTNSGNWPTWKRPWPRGSTPRGTWRWRRRTGSGCRCTFFAYD